MVIMEDESSCASDSADSSSSTHSSVASTPSSAAGSPSTSPISSPSTSNNIHCQQNSSSSSSNHLNDSSSSSSSSSSSVSSMSTTTSINNIGCGGGGGGGVSNGDHRQLRSRRRGPPPSLQQPRACTPPPSSEKVQGVKSPPTPHKIQSLDEKSLRLDENYLSISPTTKNAHNNHITANNAKPLNSTHQNKTVKYVDGENAKMDKPSLEVCPVRRRLNGTAKLTDYFVQRRSNRKTQEAINAEKHQLLVKAITDGQQDGLTAKRFSGKGRGVVATKRFLRHEFVVEYAGDLLTSQEARAREAKYAKDSGAGCYMYYFQYNNQQYCVDATKESERLGRLINHSRNGNLVTKVVEVKGTPRLILIAKRDIDVDEELTYDYGDRSREALRHHPWLAY